MNRIYTRSQSLKGENVLMTPERLKTYKAFVNINFNTHTHTHKYILQVFDSLHGKN